MSNNLIPLQTAYVTKTTTAGAPWRVCNADSNEELHQFNGSFTEKQVMSYLHFARPFELTALGIGIDLGKLNEATKSEKIFQDLKRQNLFLQQQNEMLSTKLEKFIIGEGV